MTLYEDNKVQCFAHGGRSEMIALKKNLCCSSLSNMFNALNHVSPKIY